MIKIVTDSGVSLPQSIIKEHDIRIVPATLQFGSETLRDDTLTTEDFYARLAASPAPPIGRDPLIKDFTDVYQKIVADSSEKVQILSLHVSEMLAATLDMARHAARAMHPQEIRVFDTRNTSAGQGLIVYEAAQMAKAGRDIREIENHLETMSLSIKFYTLVDTLDYLAKGGRIGTIAHRVGALLNVKPIIKVENGMVKQHGQERSRLKGILALRQLILNDTKGKQHIRLGVTHAMALSDAEALAGELCDLLKPETFLLTEISPAVGTHTGPGALGVSWYAQ
jgi:DegV family protein with EDD domain